MMPDDSTPFQPFEENPGGTIARNATIALVGGGAMVLSLGGLSRWPIATVFMLWPSFGGHVVEVWYLNALRPRLPHKRPVHVIARLAVWLISGTFLALGMRLTALVLVSDRSPLFSRWWLGGPAFAAIELLVHGVLQLRRRPNFYNGRG